MDFIRDINPIDETTLSFVWTGELRNANQLRHIFMKDITTFAISNVHIITNTSPLTDEQIEERLGLVPVLEHVNEPMHIAIEVKDRTVMSDDFKILMPNVIITDLKDGQELSVSCAITEGTGQDHCKWSPVERIGYNYNPDTKEVLFTIKSIGILSAEEIFDEGIAIYHQKFV